MIETAAALPMPKPPRRRWRWIAAAALFGLVIAWGSDRQPADVTKPIVSRDWAYSNLPTDTLRIASYNIHSGKGSDGQVDLRRIAADLQDVDVAGLYEVACPLRSLGVDQSFDLADSLHLGSAFLPTECRWWRDHLGNAVLAKSPFPPLQRIPLIGTRGKAFRQAVLLDVPLDGQTVHIVMTHLDRGQDRTQQLAAVIRLFQSLTAPAVLMGDLNTTPGDPLLQKLLAQPGVESVLTRLGADAPADNIDWIITRGLECVEATYHHSGASDHPVVKASLRLPK